MESSGNNRDLDSKIVNQGIAVFGNKGSTDQHSYFQQLRDVVLNFYATFIEVFTDRAGKSMFIKPEVMSGDYLEGFLLGTRRALHKNGREFITITIKSVSPFPVGLLFAFFEHALGIYGSLININAYHQPGLKAGQKAAAVIDLQHSVPNYLYEKRGHALNSTQLASGIAAHDDYETVFKLCERLAANPDDHGIQRTPGKTPFEATYQKTWRLIFEDGFALRRSTD